MTTLANTLFELWRKHHPKADYNNPMWWTREMVARRRHLANVTLANRITEAAHGIFHGPFFEEIIHLDDYRRMYSYAIPDTRALHAIAEYSPIVEIGAGTGYWASLLTQLGADIVCYDQHPPPSPKNGWHGENKAWHPVRRGGPGKAALHSNRTLFLCWPPYAKPFAADCLDRYRGDRVIYVGERGGCTGDRRFHHMLDKDWVEKADYAIPQWQRLHDKVWIYRRAK